MRTNSTNSRFWAGASLLFGSISLLKGLRTPGGWALSQLQITYIHGFVKRGLLGEALYLAHIRTKHAMDAVCLLELAVLVVLLVLFTRTSGLLDRRGNPGLVAAFAGSYAMTFLAHLIGYQDVLLYALAVSLLLVRDIRLRIILATPVCLGALLTHESFFVTGLPVVLLSFLLDDGKGARAARMRYVWLLLGMSVLVLLVIAWKASLSQPELQSFKRDTVARAPYEINSRVLDVLGLSTMDNLKITYQVITRNWWWWAESGVSLMVLGPLGALMIYNASGMAHGRTRAAFACASMAPLLLNFIGWDNVRWAALCALSAYLNLGLLSRTTSWESRRPTKLREQQAAILVLGLGLASGHGLMDGEKINPYPFFPPAIRPAVIRHDGIHGQVL